MCSRLVLHRTSTFAAGHEITPSDQLTTVTCSLSCPVGWETSLRVWGLPKWSTLSNARRDVMKWIYEQWWQRYRRSLRVLIWVMVYVCLRFQSLCHIHLINKADNLVLCFPQVQTVGSDHHIIHLKKLKVNRNKFKGILLVCQSVFISTHRVSTNMSLLLPRQCGIIATIGSFVPQK